MTGTCPPTGRVAGKVVVVTGAARGQGAAQALALVAQGARVVAIDVEPDGGDLREPIAVGAAIDYRSADVTDAGTWTELAAELRDTGRRLDGLVNNAGITVRSRLADITVADANRVHAVNVTGPMLAMQTLAPLMPAGSSIVNIGSIAALIAHFPVAYTTSKWALRGLSRVACLEFGPRGIRVNMIHPGYIETAMTAGASPAFRDSNVAQTPLGRTGHPAEVAALVVFLLSDESSFISGAEIPVDGGLSAQGGGKPLADAVFGTPG